jgi:hypothetical protein
MADLLVDDSQGAGTGGNNVWSTLTKVAADYIGMKRDVAIAQSRPQIATTSAPSGRPSWNTFNPFPGVFSSNPQNDGKVLPASGGVGGNALWLILGAVLLVFVLLARK